jgi:phage terminase large subunit GpA-like protein
VLKTGSTRKGAWRSDAYQVEIQDAITEPGVTQVVCIKSTQVGWSEMLNNIIGWTIDVRPMPMMLVQPSLDDAKGYSKKRIAPLIEDTPALKLKVKRATSRRAGNTLLLKEFPAGFLKMTGANSGKGLRSDPVELVIMDEADAYPEDVDGEGDPHEIALRRLDASPDGKSLIGGTPAKPKGFSKVEKLYLDSSRGQFAVPCPECEELSPLRFRDPDGTFRLVWEKDAEGLVKPETVGMLCRACGSVWKESAKWTAIDRGRWVHERPSHWRRGYAINALYSLAKKTWAEMASEWVAAQGDQIALKAFVNLRLGETWEEDGDTLEAKGLKARLERREAGVVPNGAGVMVGFADVQKNRVEAQLVAYGAGEESWLVDFAVFHGDPASAESGVWADLDAWRVAPRYHESSGRVVPLSLFLVDSGDVGHADPIYDYCRPRGRVRVFASKGVDHLDRPVLAKESTGKKSALRLFLIGTHAAKALLYSRLKRPAPGPGFVHLPDWLTEEYLEQLTAEKLVSKTDPKTRRTKREWVKARTRNEALDMTVGCLAGLFILQKILAPRAYADLEALAALHAVPLDEAPQKPAPQPAPVAHRTAARPRLPGFLQQRRGGIG